MCVIELLIILKNPELEEIFIGTTLVCSLGSFAELSLRMCSIDFLITKDVLIIGLVWRNFYL